MTDTLVPADALLELPIDALHPHPNNRAVTEDDVDDIVASARTRGIIEPLLVRDLPDQPGAYEIIAGARRHMAARVAELDHVPCIVRTGLTDRDVVELRLVENFARRDLHPLDEAEIFAELRGHGASQAEIGALLATAAGKHDQTSSQPTVSKRLSLLALSDRAKADFRNGLLTVRQAEALASLCRKAPDRADTVLDAVERNPDMADPEIRRQLQQIKAAEERAERVAELEADGVRVVDTYGWANSDNVPLSNLAVTVAEHTGEPCHAAFVDDHARVVLVCTDPAKHREPEPELPPAGAGADKSDWEARQAQQRAEREALTAAREHAAAERLAAIRRALNGNRSVTHALMYLIEEICGDTIVTDFAEEIGRVLGLVDDDTNLDELPDVIRAYPGSGGDRLAQFALALAWALGESHLNWNSGDDATQAAVRAHFKILSAEGWTPSEHDLRFIDEPTAEEPTAAPAEPEPEAAADVAPAGGGDDDGYDEDGFPIHNIPAPIEVPEGSCPASGRAYNIPGNASGIPCPVCKTSIDTDDAGRPLAHEAA